jgi:hypothetical protein
VPALLNDRATLMMHVSHNPILDFATSRSSAHLVPFGFLGIMNRLSTRYVESGIYHLSSRHISCFDK